MYKNGQNKHACASAGRGQPAEQKRLGLGGAGPPPVSPHLQPPHVTTRCPLSLTHAVPRRAVVQVEYYRQGRLDHAEKIFRDSISDGGCSTGASLGLGWLGACSHPSHLQRPPDAHIHAHPNHVRAADLYRSGKYATNGHKERVVCLVTLAMLLLAKGSRLAHTDTNATQAVQLHAQCSELLNRADQFTKNFYLTKCGTGRCGIVFLFPLFFGVLPEVSQGAAR